MKVLVADDDAVSRRLTEAALQKAGHQVLTAENGRQAWEALQQERYDVAVLDWMMPETDGVELCQRIRRQAPEGYLYVILLTAKGQRDDVITGLDAGADDYLVKPLDPDELRARVRAGGRIVELERRLRQANERLGMLASTDELTRLMNRRAILSRLDEEIERADREQTPLSIIMMDLDGFKQVNDEHGHAAGDELLRQACRRLSALVRPFDTIGRLGGDEFLLLLPLAARRDALAIGERLRAAIAHEPFTVGAIAPVQVTASFGAAVVDPHSRADAALARADAALYEAKDAGRNLVCVLPSAAPPRGMALQSPPTVSHRD